MDFEFESGIAVGSATAGLAVALRSLGCPGAWVAVPPTVCPNVVAAIMAADCRPHFVDIERASLGLDPESLRRDIAGVRAVIAVHAYGEPCRIADIVSICRPAGVVVIEDCAQAEGAADERGRPVGTVGDIAVFSYGAGKIIDLGGGGMLLARSPEVLERLRKSVEMLPSSRTADEAAVTHDEMNQAYKRLYNECYPSTLSAHRATFMMLLQKVAAEGLAAASPHRRDAIVSSHRNRLVDTIQRRRRKRDLYRARLGDVNDVSFLPTSSGGAPWRFNIWLEGPVRDHVVKTMLRDRMNVSSWHPDIRPFLPDRLYRSDAMPNAAWLSEGALNLWLDDDTSEAEVIRTSDEVRRRVESWSVSRQRDHHVSQV